MGRTWTSAPRRPNMTSATAAVAAPTIRGARHARHRRASPRSVSTLMYAAQQGDIHTVRKIIRAQPASVFERDRTGKSPLHYCCTSDSIFAAQAADYLVMAAPELVESRDEDGFTPLHLAVIAGNMPLVTFLLANHADVNAVDNEKHTVVHWATVCGETAALRAVLAAGAPISTPDVHRGYPLHYAAQMCGGEKDSTLGQQVLQILLGHSDVNVAVEDGDGRQPLLWAASAGSTMAVLALIRAGAVVEASDNDGLTALHCAASRGHTDCIDSLLTLCGASPDIIDSNGCTALHYAVTLGHADATALLLAHGADPNRQDRKGRSPAHCGCAKGQFETVKMIGAHGANLWLKNARGDLPLHEAAASGRRDLVKWLLEMRPSQINARNNDGRCPLHLAALNDNPDMCKILLDAGAHINPILRTSKNAFMTPLDCALQRGFRSTAKYLQLHGGVPASRLGDLRQHPPTGGIQVQLRDHLSFWGDTSSDSERENGEAAKKVHRKKPTSKFDRKRLSLSGSDPEVKNEFDPNLESGKKMKRKIGKNSRTVKTTGGKDNTVNIDLNHGARKSPSGRLDYANEIIINGKTEINIHQTKEINIADSDSREQINKLVNGMISNEKRPKCSTIVTGKDKRQEVKPDETKEVVAKNDQSTNTSEETFQITTEDHKIYQKIVGEIPFLSTNQVTEKSKFQPDEHSSISNTSEEVEQSKNIIVEAAVHATPEERVNQIEKEIAGKPQIVVHSPEQKTLKEPQNDLKGANDDRKSADISTKSATVHEAGAGQLQKTKIAVEIDEHAITGEIVQRKIENTGKVVAESVNAQTGSEKLSNIDQTKQKFDTDERIITTEVASKRDATETKTIDKQLTNAEAMGNLTEDTKTLTGKENEAEKNNQKVERTEMKNSDEDKQKSQIQEVTNDNQIPANESPIESHEPEKNIIVDSKSQIQEEPVSDSVKRSPDTTEDNEERKTKSKPSARPAQEMCKEEKDSSFEAVKTEKVSSQSQYVKKSQKATEDENLSSVESSTPSSSNMKEHKSFRILDEQEVDEMKGKQRKSRRSRSPPRRQRSRSEDGKTTTKAKPVKLRRSKIPTPLTKTHLSKSDKYLDVPERKTKSSLDSRVPSLPNIHEAKDKLKESLRSESNMSAPNLVSMYSDNERGSGSDLEEDDAKRSSAVRKRRVKKRSKTREAKSAGSDYESSNIIDSGFEPSPRSSRIPKWRNMSERGVNMTSVTQSIQSNIRKYHLERKIFQHLLDLKRLQIRAGQHNESMLVKRAIDAYHQSCASTVGAGRYIPEDFTFKSFEKFLYLSLRKLQRNGAEYLKGLPESPNPLLCTKSTHRCMHATHAYTGIPCAAYLPKVDHHTIPKIGFSSTQCKPGTGFLPTINPKKAVTLELCHGTDKQVISLPADRLDQNKRYYVTFTVKGNDGTRPGDDQPQGHRHSKSD